MEYTIKETRGLKGLESIKSDWQALTERITGVRFFQQWEWYKSFFVNLLDNPDAVNFLVLSKANEPMAILPYEKKKEKKYGIVFNALKLPTHSHLSPYDIVSDNREGMPLNVLIEYLRQKKDLAWDVFFAPKLLWNSSAVQQIPLKDDSLIICRPKATSSYMSCDSKTSHMDKLSKKFCRNIRRLLTRAKEKGAVSFHYVENQPELSGAHQEFIKAESSGWKGEGGTDSAICCSLGLTNFFDDVLEEFSRKNECRINLMKIDNQCAAAQFCLLQNGVLHIIKIGFDEKFKDIAPGNLLLYDLLRRCTKDPSIHTLSLVTGPPWAKRWHTLEQPVYDAIFINKTVKGALYNRLFRLKNSGWAECFQK